VGPRAGLDRCGKSLPTGIRSPDCPAHSHSLYRLLPGPHVDFEMEHELLNGHQDKLLCSEDCLPPPLVILMYSQLKIL